MPVGGEEEQAHENIEQGGGYGGRGLAAGVVGPAHAHAHLDVDNLAAQQRYIEKQVDRQPQQVSHPQLPDAEHPHLQHSAHLRRGHAGHGVGGEGQEQNEAAFDIGRDVRPPKQGVKEDKPAHAAENQQQQVQSCQVQHAPPPNSLSAQRCSC